MAAQEHGVNPSERSEFWGSLIAAGKISIWSAADFHSGVDFRFSFQLSSLKSRVALGNCQPQNLPVFFGVVPA